MPTTMTTTSTTPSTSMTRSGRLPRWTRQEILTLTEAKQAYEKQCIHDACLEPKWMFVSSFCREREVERGPLQCRKRWSNLACDFKKIKAWENKNSKDTSYWGMRSDVRRENKLPGFFDREVFELMRMDEMKVKDDEEEETVFDSGRTAREDGLFLEFEEEGEEEGMMDEPLVVVPISERKYVPEHEHYSEPGISKDKKQADINPERGSSSWEGQKRRKTSEEDSAEDNSLESKLIEALEKNGRILSEQLEAHNLNCQLEREQRKDQAESILTVMTKLANAIGKIADKL